MDLEDEDLLEQEAFFKKMAVLGKALGFPPSKKVIDNAVYHAIGSCPRGIIQFKLGKFQLTFSEARDA